MSCRILPNQIRRSIIILLKFLTKFLLLLYKKAGSMVNNWTIKPSSNLSTYTYLIIKKQNNQSKFTRLFYVKR